MSKFFGIDTPLWCFFSRLADLVILNLCFLIFCIPVVTIGPALTALYYTSMKMAEGDVTSVTKAFYHSFRENLRQGTVMWIISLFVLALTAFDLYLITGFQGALRSILHTVLLIFGLTVYMVILYTFPLLGRFENTNLNMFRNAFVMCIRHLPYTLIMALISLAPVLIFLISPSALPLLAMIYLLIGFGLTAFANSFLFSRIFAKYMPS